MEDMGSTYALFCLSLLAGFFILLFCNEIFLAFMELGLLFVALKIAE